MSSRDLQVVMLYSKGVPISVIAEQLHITVDDVRRCIFSIFDYRKIDKKRSFLELWYSSRSLIAEHYARLEKNGAVEVFREIYAILEYLAKRILYLPPAFIRYPKLISEELADRVLSYYAKVRNHDIVARMLNEKVEDVVRYINFAFLQTDVIREEFYGKWRNMAEGLLQQIVFTKGEAKAEIKELLNLERRTIELIDRVSKELSREHVELVDFFGCADIDKLVERLGNIVVSIDFQGDVYIFGVKSEELFYGELKNFPNLQLINSRKIGDITEMYLKPRYSGVDAEYAEALHELIGILKIKKVEVSTTALLEQGMLLNGGMKEKVRLWLESDEKLPRAELYLRSKGIEYKVEEINDSLILSLM